MSRISTCVDVYYDCYVKYEWERRPVIFYIIIDSTGGREDVPIQLTGGLPPYN
jgi:hypothetical protein